MDLLGTGEKELQQLTERLEKTVASYGMEISSDKSKTNSVKSIYQHMDKWENAGRSGPVQIPTHINQRNVIKRSKDQTGVSTLSHDKASSTMEQQSFFSTKIKPFESLVLDVRAGR